MTTSDRIIAYPAPDRNTPALPPYLAARLDARKARNRRLLIGALGAGVTLVSQWRELHRVQSGPNCYTVMAWVNADGVRIESCSCPWSTRQGACETYNRGTLQQHTNAAQPCKHILVCRFWALPGLERAALLIEDAEMRAAFLRGQRAGDGPTTPARAAVAADALSEVAA